MDQLLLGRTLGVDRIDKSSLKSALMLLWLDYFQTNAPAQRPRPGSNRR